MEQHRLHGQQRSTCTLGSIRRSTLTDIAGLYDYGLLGARWHVWLSTGSALDYQGSTGWWSSTGYTADNVTQALSGDWDEDGDTDLAALYDYGTGGARWHVWLSTGSSLAYQGSTGWWSTTGYTATLVKQAAAGDFNNDGKTDIAGLYDYGSGESRWHVWLSTGSSFTCQGPTGWWSSTGYTANSVKHAFAGRLDATTPTLGGPADLTALYNYAAGARWHVWLSTGSSFVSEGSLGWWRGDDAGSTWAYQADQAVKAVGTDLGGDGLLDVAVLHKPDPLLGLGAAEWHAWRSLGERDVLCTDCTPTEALSGQEWWHVDSGYSPDVVRQAVGGTLNSGLAGDVATLYDYGTSSAWHVWTGGL